jgi:hypothetical protein
MQHFNESVDILRRKIKRMIYGRMGYRRFNPERNKTQGWWPVVFLSTKIARFTVPSRTLCKVEQTISKRWHDGGVKGL